MFDNSTSLPWRACKILTSVLNIVSTQTLDYQNAVFRSIHVTHDIYQLSLFFEYC